MLLYHLICKKEIQKVKIQKLQGQKTEQYCFYQNVHCDSKKSKIFKEKEACALLSSLEIKTALGRILLVGPLLF